MNKTILFKTLIDILFVCLCLGFISLFYIVPLGLTMIAQDSRAVENWDLFAWIIFILSLSAYIFLVLGIKFLRNAAKQMLKVDYFDENIPKYLKKSGNSLIVSSLLNYLIFMIVFFKQIDNELTILFDNNLLLQIMVTIFGLFFIIQGEVLLNAGKLKNENDLTI